MNKIKFETIEINPTLAKEFLKKNVVNRTLSKRVVDRYIRDINNGNWELNGDVIRFDKGGNLIDGQHRLNAIIESNSTVSISIAYNVEQSGTIDAGYKRNDAANFQIKYNDHNFDSSVQADLALIASSFAYYNKVTVSEYKKLYDFLFNEICFVKEMPNSKKLGAILRGACIVAMKKHNIPHDQIRRFVEIVSNGYSNDETENQAIAYRNEQIKNKIIWNRGGQARVQALKQTIASILSFNKGNKGKRIAQVKEVEFKEIKELLKSEKMIIEN